MVSNQDFSWISCDVVVCYVRYFTKVASIADRISVSYPGYMKIHSLHYINDDVILRQELGLGTGDSLHHHHHHHHHYHSGGDEGIKRKEKRA